MADVVRKIEITAALSPDYQSAFKAAAGIAKDTSAQISALTKREQDLQKLAALDAQRAAAAQEGNAKAAGKAAADYERLAARLDMVGKSAADIDAELKAIGEQKSSIATLNKAASKQAELGKTAQSIEKLTVAYRKTKDPALLKALDQQKKKFRELGGSVPKAAKSVTTFGQALQRIPGPIGAVAKSFAGLRTLLSGPAGIVALIGGVAAAAVGAARKLFDLGVSAAKSGDKIIKTADALGISTDAFQELSYAMQRGGASEEDFSNGLKHLQEQMGAAVQGQSRARKAFAQFGITMDEVKSMNAEEMFYRLSESIAAIPDPAKRMRASVQLLGASGDKLSHAMDGGASSLDSLRKAARDTGMVRTRKELEQAAKASDALLDAQLSLKGVVQEVSYAVMPVVTDILKDFSKWVRDNRDKVQAFAKSVGEFARGVYDRLVQAAKWVSDNRAAISEFVKSAMSGLKSLASVLKEVAKFAADVRETVDSVRKGYQSVDEFMTGAGEYVQRGGVKTAKRGGLRGFDSGGVTVQVNVDARGADSAAGERTRRAIDAATPGTVRAIGAELEKYGEYSVSGAYE